MKRVSSCTSTKSHASARCAPGPTAAPFTAATVGLSSSQSSRMNDCTPMRSASAVLRVSKSGSAALATVDAVRSIPAQNASPVPVIRSARTFASARADAHDVDDGVAHLDRERVLGVGPVEDDAPDVIGPDGVLDHGLETYGFVVRMFTTETPEPRPPTLCWSA